MKINENVMVITRFESIHVLNGDYRPTCRTPGLTWHWGQAWCSSGRTRQSSGWGRLSPGMPLSLLAFSSAVSRARRQNSQARRRKEQGWNSPSRKIDEAVSRKISVQIYSRCCVVIEWPTLLWLHLVPLYLYKEFHRNCAETRGRSIKIVSPFRKLLLAKRPLP